MAYSEKKKKEVIDLYESGMPRGEIAEKEGISLSTVSDWTQDIVSAPLSFLICRHCKKRRRRLNIQQHYCSPYCKNAAAYRRGVQDGTATFGTTQDRQCEHCGRDYTPKHGNARSYCSKKCRTAASNQRRKAKSDRIKAERASKQAVIEARARDINNCIKTLQAAQHADPNEQIDGDKYSAEFDTLAEFIDKGNPTQIQWDTIQDLFRSAR